MKLSLCANFQEDFLAFVKKYDKVNEVYGKMPQDFIGGGRPAFMLPAISKARFKQLIKGLHDNNIEFNYLLNASCVSNQELTKKGKNKSRHLLDWLASNDVDSITVAIPFLCEFIKKNYPQFKIKVSAFAAVTNLQQVKFWEDLGADTINLQPQTVNREFELLKNISRNTKAAIQLIANQACIYACPNVNYHANLFAHSSHNRNTLPEFLPDYCSMKCRVMRLKDPTNFIRSEWIRPEDISEYEDIGITHFKLIQRNWPTEKLEKIVKAYSERTYKGDLADLTEFLFTKNSNINLLKKFKYFFRPNKANILEMYKLLKAISEIDSKVHIDNSKLDGFIDIFKKESCASKNCNTCGYCQSIAKKVVSIDNPEEVKKIQDFIDWLIQ